MTFLQRLDAARFLGLDVWDFSLRSLARPYGWVFLFAVLLRHPWRSLRGILAYRNERRKRNGPDVAEVGIASRDLFIDELSKGPWLVGLGFCEKPLQPECPAGRFNHTCWLLGQARYDPYPPACSGCHVREVAMRALKAGAALHIMTSATDVARDLLLPGLRGKPWRVVMSICPFSIPPMSLALNISGFRGLISGYARGDCRDYATWDLADRGTKREQTFLAPEQVDQLDAILEAVAAKRESRKQRNCKRFVAVGNVYVPE